MTRILVILSMKVIPMLCVLTAALSLYNCTNNSQERERNNVTIANEFVNAFYSFNRDSLEAVLAFANESKPSILFYQKWAECGHYEVLKRDTYFERNDSVVVFPVTVKDDLMEALKIDFNVTDTFHLVIRDGHIRSIQNSSNDPPEYYEAKEWVKQHRPDLVEKACVGAWNGGPTPCECVQGTVKGFAEFIAKNKPN